MKNILKLLAILLVVTSFQSCKKKGNDDESNRDLTGKIKTITSGNTTLAKYMYRTDGKIREETRYTPNGQMIISYEYADGKISSITAKTENGSIIYQYSLTYANNKLEKFILGGITNVYWQMYYNADGTVNYAIQYTPAQNNVDEPTIKQKFEYDNHKNVIEATEFWRFGSTWELHSRYEFEYDSKNNPYKDLQIPYDETINLFANLVSPNNATRVKEYDQNNVIVEDTQYQYNYNTDNYPIHVTEDNNLTYDISYY